jgi:hypothetical protein
MKQADRIKRLEETVKVLETAIHLLTSAHAPTSKWLDANMERINNDNRQ